MNCSNCNNANKPGSKFCRFCGEKLTQHQSPQHPPATSSDNPDKSENPANNTKSPLNNKTAIQLAVLILITSIAVYAIPKVQDYSKVKQDIQKINSLIKDYQYQEAANTIDSIDNKWKTQSQVSTLDNLKKSVEQNLKDQKLWSDAVAKEQEKQYTEARDLLQQIEIDFPEYKKVHDKLLDLQDKIDVGVKKHQSESARQATAASVAAARAEQDKAAAEAQAAAAEEAKAQAEAQAQAQAQAAYEAEVRAESLRTEQTNAYWDKWKKSIDYTTNGHDNINKAFGYMSSSSYESAMSYLIAALSNYDTAKNILGNDYIAENRTAHLYMQLALDNYIKEEQALFNSIYYLDASYLNQAIYFANEGNKYVELCKDSIGKY